MRSARCTVDVKMVAEPQSVMWPCHHPCPQCSSGAGSSRRKNRTNEFIKRTAAPCGKLMVTAVLNEWLARAFGPSPPRADPAFNDKEKNARDSSGNSDWEIRLGFDTSSMRAQVLGVGWRLSRRPSQLILNAYNTTIWLYNCKSQSQLLKTHS